MFALGADVEHGLYHNGQLVSAIGKIPGVKGEPELLSRSNGGIQVDNVLLEWNAPVSYTAEQFVSNITAVLEEIKFQYPQFTLGYDSSYFYPESELLHPDSQIFGCDPDFNGHKINSVLDLDNAVNPNPDPFLAKNMRTAAGHIHISHFSDIMHAVMQIRYMDMYLGLPSLFLDLDRNRRVLYGKAGAMRLKQYPNDTNGVEYRVLGTWWVKDPKYIKWVFEITQMIYNNWQNLPPIPEDIQDIINNYNLHRAGEIIKEYDLWP